MIAVYNESSTPWAVEAIKSKDIKRIVKTRTLQPRDGQDPKSQSISILGYERYLDDSLNDVFATAVKTSEPVVVDNSKLGIIFNRKAFRPFITEAGEKAPRDIVCVSLQLKRREIISFQVEKAYLLEYNIFGGEFSFVSTMVPEGPKTGSIRIVLLNRETKQQEQHHFFYDETGQLRHSSLVKVGGFIQNVDNVSRARIRKYRPSWPTHTIFVHRDDREDLNNVISSADRHNIVEFTDTTSLNEAITRIQQENYRAVTLFANIQTQSNQDPARESHYRKLTDELALQFQTVLKLYEDKQIRIIRC